MDDDGGGRGARGNGELKSAVFIPQRAAAGRLHLDDLVEAKLLEYAGDGEEGRGLARLGWPPIDDLELDERVERGRNREGLG
jgi:hypothetical protein